MEDFCGFSLNDTRRKFWSTQPEACGSEQICGDDCSVAGLNFVETAEGRTIATNDYVRGLALNILMTNGFREDRECGYRPSTRGGHWSDSFRKDGGKSGSSFRYIPISYSINETISLIRAHLIKDMSKLIDYGVATKVDVDVTYKGRQRISAVIDIHGHGDEKTNVGMSGTRLKNSWVWDGE